MLIQQSAISAMGASSTYGIKTGKPRIELFAKKHRRSTKRRYINKQTEISLSKANIEDYATIFQAGKLHFLHRRSTDGSICDSSCVSYSLW